MQLLLGSEQGGVLVCVCGGGGEGKGGGGELYGVYLDGYGHPSGQAFDGKV